MSKSQPEFNQPSPDQNNNESPSRDGELILAWDAAVSMVGDRFFMLDMAKLWGLACALLGVIMLAIGAIAQSPYMLHFSWVVPLFAFGCFYVLSMLIALVFFFNKYSVQYVITKRGVQVDLARWSAKLSKAGAEGNIVVGVFKASPTAMGTGILAETQRSVFLTWSDIRKVSIYEVPRVFTLSNSWRPVVRLHCSNQELFLQVREIIETRVPEGGGSLTRG